MKIDYKIAYETTNEIVDLYYARIKRNEEEIKRLYTIIQEVRERLSYEETNVESLQKDILEILDKENI